MSIKILTRTYFPKQSFAAFVATSFIFLILDPNSRIVLISIHFKGTLCNCTQNGTCENSYPATLPIPLGSCSTIKARSKCQGPLVNILHLSSSEEKLNMKTLFRRFFTFTTPTGRHAYCRVVLTSSWLMPLTVRILSTCLNLCSFFLYTLPKHYFVFFLFF